MAIIRDLVGYGRDRPDIIWPNGARIAISLALNFEEGAELSVEQGDSETEAFGEVPSVQPPGYRDLVQEQTFDYGMRVGLWRFLDAFRAPSDDRSPADVRPCRGTGAGIGPSRCRRRARADRARLALAAAFPLHR